MKFSISNALLATAFLLGTVSALPAFTSATFQVKPDSYVPRSNTQKSRRDSSSTLERWEWVPSYKNLPGDPAGHYFTQNSGVTIWYAEFGDKGVEVAGEWVARTPVLFLHGGLSNSDAFSHQVEDLYKDHYVITMDTRGQGRSPYANFTEMHYDDFTRDVIALLDHLSIPKAAIVGWSDGAITGLDLAMNYTARVDRVFAHGANAQYNMTLPTVDPLIWSTKRSISSDELHYDQRSPTAFAWANMSAAVNTMWNTEPAWGPEAFAKIDTPVWIVDGDHDAAINRNQPDAMMAWTPFAGELILPQVGHLCLMQDPAFFTFAIRHFLNTQYDGASPLY